MRALRAGELHNGVRINAGGGHTVRHNYIHDFRNTGSGSNASAILVDHSAGGVIEHNEIANSDGVFFIKRNYNAPGRWIVRYNYGHDSWMGIRADQLTRSPANPAHGVDIYQNLLVNIEENAFVTNHYEGAEIVLPSHREQHSQELRQGLRGLEPDGQRGTCLPEQHFRCLPAGVQKSGLLQCLDPCDL